jgi:hypothetical protein
MSVDRSVAGNDYDQTLRRLCRFYDVSVRRLLANYSRLVSTRRNQLHDMRELQPAIQFYGTVTGEPLWLSSRESALVRPLISGMGYTIWYYSF